MRHRISLPRRLTHVPVLMALAVTGSTAAFGADKHPQNLAFRIVAPTSPGSPPDVISRLIANEIAGAEGWRFVVENRPGALQTIAMGDVLKQPPDGLSIFPMSTGVVAVPALLPEKGIRLEADFAPVARIASGYLAVVVHPSVPAATIAELVALLKARPDKLSFSSGGFGTPAHLAAEVFMLHTGTRAIHVPYPQAQQRIADLLSGATQFAFFNTPAVVAHIASGKLRALAVTAPQRVAALKDVPTVDEQGFPGLRIMDWQAFTVRGGSPNDVITRLNAAVNRALDKRSVQDALLRIGYQATSGTPAELGSLIRSEVAYWRKVVVDSGITVQR